MRTKESLGKEVLALRDTCRKYFNELSSANEDIKHLKTRVKQLKEENDSLCRAIVKQAMKG